jgi:hypothetical protein
LALSFRRVFALGRRAGEAVVALLLTGVLAASVRIARAWRSFAISSSMAFNIWSFNLFLSRVAGEEVKT